MLLPLLLLPLATRNLCFFPFPGIHTTYSSNVRPFAPPPPPGGHVGQDRLRLFIDDVKQPIYHNHLEESGRRRSCGGAGPISQPEVQLLLSARFADILQRLYQRTDYPTAAAAALALASLYLHVFAKAFAGGASMVWAGGGHAAPPALHGAAQEGREGRVFGRPGDSWSRPRERVRVPCDLQTRRSVR